MTVREIIADYLKQNGYDGLHSHWEDNRYGGCACRLKNLFYCGEACHDCEPAYAHNLGSCKKCPYYDKCEPQENRLPFGYCGNKMVPKCIHSN